MATKRQTAADIAAAVKLGAMAPDTEVITADQAAKAAAKAAAEATSAVTDRGAGTLPADHHECGLPGCRHGAAHGAPTQPDRQVKLQCPTCGAVARMTVGALMRAARQVGGADMTAGYPRCADGGVYSEAARRQYNRK